MTHYILTEKELISLLEETVKLSILEDGGVDNWENYGEVFRELEKEHNREKREDEEWEDSEQIIESLVQAELSRYKTTTVNE